MITAPEYFPALQRSPIFWSQCSMRMRVLVLLLLLVATNRLQAQCGNLGQSPSTAFPVCGSSVFSQATVPLCVTHQLNVPGCSGGRAQYEDRNPYWYRFTCYQSGSLSFLITPNDLGDDYDWMLYDITNRNPDDVFTNNSLIVTGNWAGTFGLTGASSTGVNYIHCSSDPADNRPSFARSPDIVQGHTYLLMISHFTNTQSGYKLSFGGGTAVITDPKDPAIEKAWAGCGGVTMTIVLNKKMKCNSLAANGSDFSISPAAGTIVSAVANGCNSSFDMDTVVLTMSNALPPGNYTIGVKDGSDGNTLLDNCARGIPTGTVMNVRVDPVQPTPMDSIKPIGCAPNVLELVFDKPMNCNSIAANGSDFSITGTTPVTIVGASGICSKGVTGIIRIQLAAPIQTAGNYQLQLVRGNDGNSVIDECGQETPPGASLNFSTADTVNANFTYQLLYGCKKDTVDFTHPGGNNVNVWNWRFDADGSSIQQSPRFIFPTFGFKDIRLIVSNGVCSDTANTTVHLDNEMRAAFAYPEVVCPEDMAVYTDTSIGKLINWDWDFGNGDFSRLQAPPPVKYPQVTNGKFKIYPVRLIVENNLHCFDTVTHQVKVVFSCYITVPNAFTPNNDLHNDKLYPLNAFKAMNLEFMIFNRYGQLVYKTNDWTRQWDGTINGNPQPMGTYVWTLRYTDRDTGQKVFRRGTTVLIR